jgi:hypothetical protein
MRASHGLTTVTCIHLTGSFAATCFLTRNGNIFFSEGVGSLAAARRCRAPSGGASLEDFGIASAATRNDRQHSAGDELIHATAIAPTSKSSEFKDNFKGHPSSSLSLVVYLVMRVVVCALAFKL